MKIKVINNNQQDEYVKWAKKHFTVVDDPGSAEAILLIGGSDVDPVMYGEFALPTTSTSSSSDLRDVYSYFWARQFNLPMLGICRGAQVLCVLNGGRLVQHVTNHNVGYTKHHPIFTYDEYILHMNSTHHQMMLPFLDGDNPAELVAVCAGESKSYSSTDQGAPTLPETMEKSPIQFIKQETPEPEIVYWPRTRCLGIQGHPEQLQDDSSLPPYKGMAKKPYGTTNKYLDRMLETWKSIEESKSLLEAMK